MKTPFWAFYSLGEKVRIMHSFDDGINVYPVGSVGRLMSIQAGDGSPYATVVMDEDSTGAEESFNFSVLRLDDGRKHGVLM